LRWKNDRYQLKGLAVLSHIAKSDKINRYYGKQVGSKQYGLYAVAAVNMRKWFENSEETESQLWVFSRISQLNTQASPVGFRADKSNEQTDFAIGINYNPIEDVVIKADYQWIHHPTLRTIQQVNIGLGFDF
jgi:opacity protein-like surface antigen